MPLAVNLLPPPPEQRIPPTGPPPIEPASLRGEVGGEGANRENKTTPCWTAMMPSFGMDAGREVAIQQPAGTREMVVQGERR